METQQSPRASLAQLAGPFSILALVASVLLGAMAWNEIKSSRFVGQDVAPQNTITVSGEGEVFAVPDTGEFTFGANAQAPVVANAQAKVTEIINAAIAFLKEQGIEDNDIKTVGYNVYPRYEYRRDTVLCRAGQCPPSGEQVLVGFEVSQTIAVKVRDVSTSGTILGGIGEIGVTNVSSLNFTIDDQSALEREARQKAIVDAKEKADMLAADLGVKLVRIVSFTESGNFPVYAKFDTVAESRALGAATPAPQVPVGENRIVSNVTLTYEIRD